MKLISCDSCSVLLDGDRIDFPSERLIKDDGSVDPDTARWNGQEYVAYVPCPVCGEDILETEGF